MKLFKIRSLVLIFILLFSLFNGCSAGKNPPSEMFVMIYGGKLYNDDWNNAFSGFNLNLYPIVQIMLIDYSVVPPQMITDKHGVSITVDGQKIPYSAGRKSFYLDAKSPGGIIDKRSRNRGGNFSGTGADITELKITGKIKLYNTLTHHFNIHLNQPIPEPPSGKIQLYDPANPQKPFNLWRNTDNVKIAVDKPGTGNKSLYWIFNSSTFRRGGFGNSTPFTPPANEYIFRETNRWVVPKGPVFVEVMSMQVEDYPKYKKMPDGSFSRFSTSHVRGRYNYMQN